MRNNSEAGLKKKKKKREGWAWVRRVITWRVWGEHERIKWVNFPGRKPNFVSGNTRSGGGKDSERDLCLA